MTTKMLTAKNAHAALEAAKKRRDEIKAQKLDAANELRAAEQAVATMEDLPVLNHSTTRDAAGKALKVSSQSVDHTELVD